MADKFHINSLGEPGTCRAKQDRCPFGQESDHYPTKELAAKAYEVRMQGRTFKTASKNPKNRENEIKSDTNYPSNQGREPVNPINTYSQPGLNGINQKLMNLSTVERSRVQLYAVKKGFSIVVCDDHFEKLAKEYQKPLTVTADEIRPYLKVQSEELKDALTDAWRSIEISAGEARFTPDVSGYEKLAEALVSMDISIAGKGDPKPGSSVRRLTENKKKEMLAAYGIDYEVPAAPKKPGLISKIIGRK